MLPAVLSTHQAHRKCWSECFFLSSLLLSATDGSVRTSSLPPSGNDSLAGLHQVRVCICGTVKLFSDKCNIAGNAHATATRWWNVCGHMAPGPAKRLVRVALARTKLADFCKSWRQWKRSVSGRSAPYQMQNLGEALNLLDTILSNTRMSSGAPCKPPRDPAVPAPSASSFALRFLVLSLPIRRWSSSVLFLHQCLPSARKRGSYTSSTFLLPTIPELPFVLIFAHHCVPLSASHELLSQRA